MKASKQKSKISKFLTSRKTSRWAGLLAVAFLIITFAGVATFTSGGSNAATKSGSQQLKAADKYCVDSLKTKKNSPDWQNCVTGWIIGYVLKSNQICQSNAHVKKYMIAAVQNGNRSTDSKVYKACLNGQSTKAADTKKPSSGGGGSSSGGSSSGGSTSSAAEQKAAEAKKKAAAAKAKKAEAARKKAEEEARKRDTCANGACRDKAADPNAKCDVDNGCDLVTKYVNPAINLLSMAFGLIATISIIIGGIQYASSTGEPQKVTEAKQRIIKTLVAVAAYFFLFAFLQFLIPGGLFN